MRCTAGFYTVFAKSTPKLTISGFAKTGPVIPGDGEVEIIIKSIRERNSSVRGRFVDSSGVPVKGGNIYCYGKDLIPMSAPRDGFFEFGPMAAGKYRICADCPGLAKIMFSRELKESEALDIGNITIPQGGRLEASVQMDGRAPPRGLEHLFTIELSSSILAYAEKLEVVDGLLVCRSIAPGKYNLTTTTAEIAGGISYTSVPFEIETGKTTKLQIFARRGVTRNINFTEGDGAAPLAEVTGTIIDSRGEMIATSIRKHRSLAFDSNLSWAVSLPVGKYHIRAVASDGRKGESVFNIERDDEKFSFVDVLLR